LEAVISRSYDPDIQALRRNYEKKRMDQEGQPEKPALKQMLSEQRGSIILDSDA
jgi:hypothetical protein